MSKVYSRTGIQHAIGTKFNILKGAVTVIELELLFSYQFIPMMKSDFDHTNYTKI